MSSGGDRLKRVAATIYLIAIHIALIYLAGERLLERHVHLEEPGPKVVNDPIEKTEVPTPVPIPSVFADAASPTVSPTPPETSDNRTLVVPVEGIRPDQLVDSFTDARSSGRVHDAIDKMAPAGTPVRAAADGEIVKFFDSVPGGITIYQLSTNRRLVYYYAHLQRRSDDVKVGDTVKQGKVIAYVGDTGNAGPGNYHLHFSIAQAIDPKRYWEGTYLNPYPYLKSGRAPEVK